MRLLLVLLLFLNVSFTQSGVLICMSTTAYAYHSGMCRGLQQCTHSVQRISQADAVKSGRKPCRYCFRSTSVASQNDGALGQCRATTQKGTRCSLASRTDGYCWQHGG